MVEFLTASDRTAASTKAPVHWLPYVLAGLIANTGMWGLALFSLKTMPPNYSSSLMLSLPGTVTHTSVNLPEIGTASAQGSSPYANTDQDPRENYKIILTSPRVLSAAAAKLNMPPGEFGKPRIKIVDNTTLMSLELSADSPEEAQKKSWAFYEAFQASLNELRTQEAAQKEAKVQAIINEAKKKLEAAQKRLSDYKARSGLVSDTQVEQLASTIEQLRRQRAETLAQQQQSLAQLKQLSTNLEVTAPQAGDAFILKADQLFQQYLKDYSDSTAQLVVLKSKFLPNHPAVMQEQSKQNSIKAALIARSVALLGQPVDQATLDQLNIGGSTQNGSARETFFQDLVKSQVEQQGYAATAQELDRQIAELEAKLKSISQSQSTLDALKRDLQINEAVFSSTLGGLDISKSNLYGSYPEVQLLTEPSYPDSPHSPKKKLVLLGAAFGSVLMTSGLGLLWWYKRREIQLPNKTLNGQKHLAKL